MSTLHFFLQIFSSLLVWTSLFSSYFCVSTEYHIGYSLKSWSCTKKQCSSWGSLQKVSIPLTFAIRNVINKMASRRLRWIRVKIQSCFGERFLFNYSYIEVVHMPLLPGTYTAFLWMWQLLLGNIHLLICNSKDITLFRRGTEGLKKELSWIRQESFNIKTFA